MENKNGLETILGRHIWESEPRIITDSDKQR
jgi:hypothetical protein